IASSPACRRPPFGGKPSSCSLLRQAKRNCAAMCAKPCPYTWLAQRETMTKRILGISAYYHDSAAALVCDGEIVAAAQEERFTRKKHDAAFPRHAAAWCVGSAGLRL